MGYYLDGSECLDCPQTCVSCTDDNTCTRCKTGYWGMRCENECPLDCVGCDERGYCTAGTCTVTISQIV